MIEKTNAWGTKRSIFQEIRLLDEMHKTSRPLTKVSPIPHSEVSVLSVESRYGSHDRIITNVCTFL